MVGEAGEDAPRDEHDSLVLIVELSEGLVPGA
jgi:hypothetical protein